MAHNHNLILTTEQLRMVQRMAQEYVEDLPPFEFGRVQTQMVLLAICMVVNMVGKVIPQVVEPGGHKYED